MLCEPSSLSKIAIFRQVLFYNWSVWMKTKGFLKCLQVSLVLEVITKAAWLVVPSNKRTKAACWSREFVRLPNFADAILVLNFVAAVKWTCILHALKVEHRKSLKRTKGGGNFELQAFRDGEERGAQIGRKAEEESERIQPTKRAG